jgi:hypothetical protein
MAVLHLAPSVLLSLTAVVPLFRFTAVFFGCETCCKINARALSLLLLLLCSETVLPLQEHLYERLCPHASTYLSV